MGHSDPMMMIMMALMTMMNGGAEMENGSESGTEQRHSTHSQIG